MTLLQQLKSLLRRRLAKTQVLSYCVASLQGGQRFRGNTKKNTTKKKTKTKKEHKNQWLRQNEGKSKNNQSKSYSTLIVSQTLFGWFLFG